MINQAEFQKKLERISNLPTLPSVVERMTRLLSNPRTTAEEIGHVIQTDQSLASNVLKLVNSAFYGFPGRISTVTHAVVILGFSTVKNIVITASVLNYFKSKGDQGSQFDTNAFWVHSLSCGAASKTLAKYTGSVDPDQCFMGGLLHDIGKIILYHYFPEEFIAVLANVKKKDILIFDSEREILGQTHQDIGAHVARHWNLPGSLQRVIRYHHAPSNSAENQATCAIVHCADILIRALAYGSGGDGKIPVVEEKSWDMLGLKLQSLEQILKDIDEEVDKSKDIMDLV